MGGWWCRGGQGLRNPVGIVPRRGLKDLSDCKQARRCFGQEIQTPWRMAVLLHKRGATRRWQAGLTKDRMSTSWRGDEVKVEGWRRGGQAWRKVLRENEQRPFLRKKSYHVTQQFHS